MAESMLILHDNNPSSVFEKHFSLKCPNCNIPSNISAVSIPRYEFLARFRPKTVGIVYRCDACNGPIFLEFNIQDEQGSNRFRIFTNYREVVRAKETYDLANLPTKVSTDFNEALTCFSNSCFNAFAAMCRRTVQSASEELGASGQDKVLKQIKELREMAEIDEETFEILKTIVIAGHDGAHPHLPPLSEERAEILLELMKDVLYQLFIRKKKMQEAAVRRKESIAKNAE